MFSQQDIAWLIYAIVSFLFCVLLIYRCCYNIYLVPFILYSLSIAIGHVYLIVTHGESLVLTVLPTLSLFLFAGIMESQLIFIGHITTAMQNRDFWGSLYLRSPEKKALPIHTRKRSIMYWFSLACLVCYTLLSLLSLFLIHTLGHAITVSLLCLVVLLNTTVMIYFTRKHVTYHAQLIRRNRDDLVFLRITPIFFSLGMIGMTVLVWLPYTPLVVWIVLESLFVYSPFLSVLLLCIHTGKFKKIGRQYRVEEDQKLYNHQKSYRPLQYPSTYPY